MYRFLLAVMLSLSIAHVFSQNRTREYTFKQPEQQVSTSLYDTIILLDKRDIKDNLGIVQVGAFNAKAQVIAEPSLEKQLQVQLINAVSGDRGRGQLLLRLDKFCIAELTGAFSESGYFDFTAVLFSKDETDSYREIASIDTSLTVGGLDVTKKILNKSSQIVNEFIVNNLNANPANEVAHSLADIDRYHEYLKKEIPLYNRTIPEDGLYADYEEFRQQMPSAGLVEIKKNKPALGFYQKNVLLTIIILLKEKPHIANDTVLAGEKWYVDLSTRENWFPAYTVESSSIDNILPSGSLNQAI